MLLQIKNCVSMPCCSDDKYMLFCKLIVEKDMYTYGNKLIGEKEKNTPIPSWCPMRRVAATI